MPDNDVQAHLADGTTLHFPMGTDPSVVSMAAKNHIVGSQTQMPKGPIAPQPLAGKMQPESSLGKQVVGQGKEFGQGILDIPRSLPAMGEALAYPEKSIGEPAANYWQQTKQQFGQGNPTWIANLVNTILTPTMLPQSVQAFVETAQKNPARAAGQAAGMYATGKIPEVPEIVRTGAQDYFRIGKPFLQEGAQKVGAENVEALTKHDQATAEALAGQKEKIQQAKISEPQKFDEANAKFIEARDAALAARKEKLQQAKISEPQAFSEAESKHQQRVQTIQQANAESQAGFQQRQQHLDIANQHAQTISDRLEPLYQAARKEASDAYGPQPKGAYEAREIKNLIQDTASSKLQGNTKLPAAVSKIIADIDKPPEPTLLDQASVFRGAGKEMRGAGKTVSEGMTPEVFSSMDPKWREAFLKRASPEMRERVTVPESTAQLAGLDAQRIHGFMSELGKAGRSASLSPDEASAINATRQMLEGRLRKLYDSEGRTGDFTKGQAAWKQMANTFENTKPTASGGSPIARALATKDPVTGKLRPEYVQSILSDDKAFPVAKDMLDRYTHLGSPKSELEVMKTHGDFADTLPSQVKWKDAPEGPNYPKFTEFGKLPEVPDKPNYPKFTEWGNLPKTPEPPSLAEFDPIEARKVALKQTAQGMGSMKGIRGVMDLLALSRLLKGDIGAVTYPFLRRSLSSGIGSEKVMNWLSRATPEELQMAKDIPAKAVALRKKSASISSPSASMTSSSNTPDLRGMIMDELSRMREDATNEAMGKKNP